jgi:choline dehydrogenase-like flavoprotein
MAHDVIIVGSGAGGCAAAYSLAQAGFGVLLIERGPMLPLDGSTLDVAKVFRERVFLEKEVWLDGAGRRMMPHERSNLGGKTKWYGAALPRFGAHEFDPDPAHDCLAWPIAYEELAPFYAAAEELAGVRHFPTEPDLAALAAGLARRGWCSAPLPMGLAPEIFDTPSEARRFDGFASPTGLKSDGQTKFLERVRHNPNLRLLTGKAVTALLPARATPRSISGVVCQDGTTYRADMVLLAAGALHSPRLLQTYLERTALAEKLACYRHVGRNYKMHVATSVLAFSPRRKTDLIRKTTLLLHDDLPHSSVQPLGWFDSELFTSGAPPYLARWAASFLGTRAYDFPCGPRTARTRTIA